MEVLFRKPFPTCLSSRVFGMFSCASFMSHIKVCDPFRIIFARRMMEGVNSNIMYWKNFCECHPVSPVQQKYDYEK
jgi:hypothetical protein